MERIPALAFKVFGIFPFKLQPTSVKYCRQAYTWSIIYFIVLFPAYMWRAYYYLLYGDESSTRIFYDLLTKFEPYLNTMRMIMTFAIVLHKKFVKKLKKLMNLLIEFESEECKVVQMRIFVIECATLTTVSFVVLRNNFEADFYMKLDVIITLVQDLNRGMIFTQLCTYFYIIMFELNTIIKGLRMRNCDNSIQKLHKVLSAYAMFNRIYKALIMMMNLECMYDVTFGLRCAEDYFLMYELKNTMFYVNDEVLVIWYLIHVPFLFLLIHIGHKYQKKVLLFNKLTEKLVIFL